MTHKLKPRQGDLPDDTELLLNHLAQYAPDLARVLRKYMPTPADEMKFVSNAAQTVRDYVQANMKYWNIERQAAFLEQTRLMGVWINDVNSMADNHDT